MLHPRTLARMLTLLALVALLGVALLASGCGRVIGTVTGDKNRPDEVPAAMAPIKIGTLGTEDSLPLWAAEKMGYFGVEGIKSLEIVRFQSAQERDAAFASGAIDAFMGDIIAAANLEASGKKVTIATVMLGGDQSQGRFGVVVPPKSTVADLKALANVPVGTSSATIQEYVLDGLMAEAGVSADQVKVEEVKKVPVRFELLMAGKLKAAALPEPFLTLAEQGGAKLVGDDTRAQKNLSQTTLVFADDYLKTEGGTETMKGVLGAWDSAANDINKAPDSYRAMLVDKAGLPKPLADAYKVQTYPMAQPPDQADVDAVLAWMTAKGYLKVPVTYTDLTQ